MHRWILGIAIVVGWISFLFLDSLWNRTLREAVSAASGTYGELYGPLSFFRPAAMYFAFVVSIVSALMLIRDALSRSPR